MLKIAVLVILAVAVVLLVVHFSPADHNRSENLGGSGDQPDSPTPPSGGKDGPKEI